MANINKKDGMNRHKKRFLVDRLERSCRQKRRSSPPHLLAPMPSSNNLARRRCSSSTFEWRKRVQHLDHLEDQYMRDEQEMWNLEFSAEECPKREQPPIRVKPNKKRAKTVGVQVNVPGLSARAERDLCERERKQRQILLRRERERVERQLREQERDRQRTLLAKQQQLDRQRLEKARQQRDRRLREQQQKVKERRDYERYLLFKKREEQRLQDQCSRARRRPSTPSSQNVELVEEVGIVLQQASRQDPKQNLRHMSLTAMTVPAESDPSQSARREQQLHLRAENVRQKVLAYEKLKEFHREKARAKRDRQLRMRDVEVSRTQFGDAEMTNLKETTEEEARKKQKKERTQGHQKKEMFEQLKSEIVQMEDLKGKAMQRQEREIKELKMKLNEVQDREKRYNEVIKRISQNSKELEKREKDECERLAEEEELLREKRLLEKLKRSKSERDELDRKAREEDLKREQILTRWVQMQELQEKRETEEREERLKSVVECERKIEETVNTEDKANKQSVEGLDRLKEVNDHLSHQSEKLDQKEKERDERLRQMRERREQVIQLECEKREFANNLKEQFEKLLESHKKDELLQNHLEKTRLKKSQDLVTIEVETAIKSQNCEDQATEEAQIREDSIPTQDTRIIASEGKTKTQPQNMESPPGDVNPIQRSSSKKIPRGESNDFLTKVQSCCQQGEPEPKGDQNVRVWSSMLMEKNNRLKDQVLEWRQVLGELRLEAGQLAEQNPSGSRCQRKSSIAVQERKIENNPVAEKVVDDKWSHLLKRCPKSGEKASSSHEYFQPGASKTRSERWSRFIGSEEESEDKNLASQRRNRESSSSSENNPDKGPRYSLVDTCCPRNKIYTVEEQNIQPTPYGNSEQQKAYNSYVRKRVAKWRKTLRPNSLSTDEEEPEERESGGGKSNKLGLTYCTQTGKKRYPKIRKGTFKQKDDQVQQNQRVFGHLLKEARTSEYHQETLSGEICLLQRKLLEGQASATSQHSQKAAMQAAWRVIGLFQLDDAYASCEEEFETSGNELPEQIYLQETESKMKLPRPVFQTLMAPQFPSNLPHLVEKMVVLDNELEAHLKKISNRVFARQGGKELRRKMDHLVDQQRRTQRLYLAKMCRESEEELLHHWRRLARNSLLGLREVFHDYCDMRDRLPCMAKQTIEGLYSEWKERRFAVQ
ncbi:trichohyalin [Drosophila elegans]|uniref:trichohyalin n=1 Tax=Drosophila elegans TaxID=30023 RepID=UPI0007E6A508|nr:trichohyalin [Drosophila elegans]